MDRRDDARSKKIIFVSSCLLNTNNKVQGLARYPGMCKEPFGRGAPETLELIQKYLIPEVAGGRDPGILLGGYSLAGLFSLWAAYFSGAPNVINTFAKGYDWKGKKIGIFATSGGSGTGKTAAKLQPYVEGAEIVDAQVNLPLDEDSLKAWADKILSVSFENLEKWEETV